MSPEQALKWFMLFMRVGGLVIALHAAFYEHFDRPSLYLLAGGMMGLEEVVKWARKRNGKS